MKMLTAIAACLLLAPRATLCGETDVERLSKGVSELDPVQKANNTNLEKLLK